MLNSIEKLQFKFVIKPAMFMLRFAVSRSEQFGVLQTVWWFFMLTCNITWLVLSCVQLKYMEDIQDIFQIFINVSSLTQALAGQIAGRIYELKIQEILDTIHREFWFDEEKYDKELYSKHNYYYKLLLKFTTIYQVTAFICLSFWFLNPSLISSRKFGMDINFPYNNFIKRSPYYEVTFVLMIITIFPTAFVVAFQDCLFCSCVTTAICQLNFIKHKLKILITKECSEEKIYHGLKECIDHHNLILHFLKDVEMMSRYMMLCKFICGVFSLLGVRIALSVAEGNLKIFSILAISGVQPLMYCFFGDFITSECESIGEQAYDTHWEEVPYKKGRFALLMIIERSQRPVLMTAGGMIILCLPNYVAFIKMIFSFHVLLENLDN